jgi:hypothetical protein
MPVINAKKPTTPLPHCGMSNVYTTGVRVDTIKKFKSVKYGKIWMD